MLNYEAAGGQTQKKRTAGETTARLLRFYLYGMFPKREKNWPEAYNYHPFFTSILLLYFFYTSLPALNINSPFLRLCILDPSTCASAKASATRGRSGYSGHTSCPILRLRSGPFISL
jgi:hypothetical protein